MLQIYTGYRKSLLTPNCGFLLYPKATSCENPVTMKPIQIAPHDHTCHNVTCHVHILFRKKIVTCAETYKAIVYQSTAESAEQIAVRGRINPHYLWRRTVLTVHYGTVQSTVKRERDLSECETSNEWSRHPPHLK